MRGRRRRVAYFVVVISGSRRRRDDFRYGVSFATTDRTSLVRVRRAAPSPIRFIDFRCPRYLKCHPYARGGR